MTKLLVVLFIGFIAGIIDIIPMIIQKLDKYAIISAFVHWIVLAFLISYIVLPMPAWLKGLIIAELAALPILVLVWKDDPKSVIPIVIMSAILGLLVGIVTARLC